MNYPIWSLPASGLLIAAVAIVHVFVSHFAVGGGLFLVWTERKAYREEDPELLGYIRRLSRFFILLTLVFGAVTGVGIWFTIGLVHPAATSSLINIFVWGWAIEWVFFFVEITAAIVYYYGWDRLDRKRHLAVGWIYFGAAFASLVVINGILSFMLTPGAWLETHSFFDGFFNPTYVSSLVIRSLGAIGLAGVYALFTASWLTTGDLKKKVSRYAVTGWVAPMAIGLPFALLWYFADATRAAIPVGEIFGAASSRSIDLLRSAFLAPATGYPTAHLALRVSLASITLTIVLSLIVMLTRARGGARVLASLLMIAALAAVGSSEWVREDLRKPFVISNYMFVNGTRMPAPDGSPAAAQGVNDPLRVDHLQQSGIVASALYTRASNGGQTDLEHHTETGAELFRLTCSECHTVDGYLAIRPLVRGKSVVALEGVIDRLAVPRHANGQPALWSQPGVELATWRNRRMPPFPGNEDERHALAIYLATLGGGEIEAPPSAAGATVFDASCGMCHGEGTDWPLEPRLAGKNEAQIYDLLGRLPQLNDAMPEFEGTDADRHALATYLYATRVKGGK
ncbi:MAG: cytochrome ubiquinol oxidase subunit I [Thermoanaerobaculia bacterium]